MAHGGGRIVARAHRAARLGSGLAILALFSATAAPLGHAAETVAARIGPATLTCESLQADTADACAAALLRELRARAERRFIDAYGLTASADEIAALHAYERAFAAHDRAQRALKLAELEQRLAQLPPDADPAERERLREFRAVLERLEAYDADVDRGVGKRPELPVETAAHWIEQAKLDAALYRRYGGSVGLKPSGAYAHEARAALVAEFMRTEGIELPDPEVASRFFAALWAPPAIAYTGPAPDFTPFWLQPLRPSYVGP